MPACAITSTVLASNWSFCFVVFIAGRSSVGPNTIARLCKDILFSFSCWWTLKMEYKYFLLRAKFGGFFFQKPWEFWTHLNKWSNMKFIVFLLCGGTSPKIFCSSVFKSASLMLLNLLNVSIKRRYRISVNRVSGNSRKNDLNMPVTEWMSTSFNSCSAS